MLPILLIVFSFDVKATIPLTQAILASGGFMNMLLKTFMRHPKHNKPLIFYHFMLHVMSTMLLGTTYGVMLNSIFPSWLVIALLAIVTFLLAYSAVKKAISAYKK